jgi:hypothetical protein
MALSPRLALKRWRLRHQPVPRDGKPLGVTEWSWFNFAEFAMKDTEGTRRLAVTEDAAEMRAAAGDGGES